jgi:hypothetical protein
MKGMNIPDATLCFQILLSFDASFLFYYKFYETT